MDPIWVDDIHVLKTNYDIWPSNENTLHANYNAMLRFLILYTIMLSLYKQSTVPFAMLFITMIILYLFYKLIRPENQKPYPNLKQQMQYQTQQQTQQQMQQQMPRARLSNDPSIAQCKSSTESNPFMNPILGESFSDTYKPICDFNTNKMVDNAFVNTLPQSEWDIYNNMNSQRQFYTVPNHTSYSDQGEFAKWLYTDHSRRI